MDWEMSALPALFLVGLLGASHCAGMCGPIAVALGGASGRRSAIIWGYQLGRISSYMAVGLVAGWVSQLTAELLQLAPLLRLLAAALVAAMGLYVMGAWRGLVRLEKLGAHVWKRIQPLSRPLTSVNSGAAAYAVGAVWGWLPCGLVYTAVGMALVSGSALQGALGMAAFGLGTLPAMLAASWFSGQLSSYLQKPWLRSLSGLLLLGMAVMMVVTLVTHQAHRNSSDADNIDSSGSAPHHHHTE